jgi:ArsR family transcriptional regulator, arsenate/arsenite/antimonite-responsive transcriptional repressor / arsenate reductase (thioredoxin)
METTDIAAAFTALGQPLRLDLLRVLDGAGAEGLAAGTVAERLGVGASTLSFHLRVLEQVGLIAQHRDGRHLRYALQPLRLRALADELASLCPGAALPRPRGRGRVVSQMPYRVLFLCTRNSARSIMAEAILTRLAPGRFEAHSAGSEPNADGPMPEVIQQLKALGHDTSVLRSKSWDEFTRPDAPRFDFVIALCDTVRGQVCPDFGAATVTAAWPLPDPAKFSGSLAERATLVNELYAMLRRRLEIFVSLPFATLNGMALKARLDELAQPPQAAKTGS